MARIQELTDQLQGESDNSQEVVELAISSINTLLNLSENVLIIFTLVLAMLAFFGLSFLKREAQRKAEQVANERLDSHPKSNAFTNSLREQLKEEVEKHWQSGIHITLVPPEGRQRCPAVSTRGR